MSPTRAIAELVQQMEKTILLWCSCLHLGHTESWALLRDAVLIWEHPDRNGRKAQKRQQARIFGWPKAEYFQRSNTKCEIQWNQSAEDTIGKKPRRLTRSVHAVLVQRIFPTGWLGWLLNNVEKTEYCLSQ